MTFAEYINKLASYDYIIKTTNNYKTKRDFTKARERLIKKRKNKEKA